MICCVNSLAKSLYESQIYDSRGFFCCDHFKKFEFEKASYNAHQLVGHMLKLVQKR